MVKCEKVVLTLGAWAAVQLELRGFFLFWFLLLFFMIFMLDSAARLPKMLLLRGRNCAKQTTEEYERKRLPVEPQMV